MSIEYKIDVVAALKAAGFSSYRIRKERLLGEATLQKLRNKEPVSWDNISTVCALLDCQLGDLMEYIPDAPPVGLMDKAVSAFTVQPESDSETGGAL